MHVNSKQLLLSFMGKNYKILIVDDHLLIIDGYKNALKFGFSNSNHFGVEIDFAIDCDSAIDKVISSKKTNPFDLIILDLSLPHSNKRKIKTGEELGVWIKSEIPNVKFIIVTGHEDNYRISNVLKKINPMGFLLKREISSMDLVSSVKDVLEGKPSFSKTVISIMRNSNLSNFSIDDISSNILKEISNGTRTKNLDKYIPLSKSSIEKKKRALKMLLKVETDRDLILKAKERGFI